MQLFDKKTCERCGKQYTMRTLSENRGKHFCRDCVKTCSSCGKKLSMGHWFGQTYTTNAFAHSLEKQEKPWIGSGMCMDCFNNKINQEEKEQRLIREAQVAQAKQILGTQTDWICDYCKTVNQGKFCSNCGASRKTAN